MHKISRMKSVMLLTIAITGAFNAFASDKNNIEIDYRLECLGDKAALYDSMPESHYRDVTDKINLVYKLMDENSTVYEKCDNFVTQERKRFLKSQYIKMEGFFDKLGYTNVSCRAELYGASRYNNLLQDFHTVSSCLYEFTMGSCFSDDYKFSNYLYSPENTIFDKRNKLRKLTSYMCSIRSNNAQKSVCYKAYTAEAERLGLQTLQAPCERRSTYTENDKIECLQNDLAKYEAMPEKTYANVEIKFGNLIQPKLDDTERGHACARFLNVEKSRVLHGDYFNIIRQIEKIAEFPGQRNNACQLEIINNAENYASDHLEHGTVKVSALKIYAGSEKCAGYHSVESALFSRQAAMNYWHMPESNYEERRNKLFTLVRKICENQDRVNDNLEHAIKAYTAEAERLGVKLPPRPCGKY